MTNLQNMLNLNTISRALVAVALLAGPASAAIIVNGGFESGGLSGWTVGTQVGSDGTFFVQSGTLTPVNGLTVPAPPKGNNAAMSDAGGPGTRVMYQDFVVPVGFNSGLLSFQLFLNNMAPDYFIAPTATGLDFFGLPLNQQFRVDLMKAPSGESSIDSADVLQTIYQTNAGDPLVSGYSQVSVDISAVLAAQQGNKIRLRFAQVDNVDVFNVGIDDVSIASAQVPEPSSILTMLGMAGMAGLAVLRRRSVY